LSGVGFIQDSCVGYMVTYKKYTLYFILSESGNITKMDLFHTNLGRFGIYYIRRCSQVIIIF